MAAMTAAVMAAAMAATTAATMAAAMAATTAAVMAAVAVAAARAGRPRGSQGSGSITVITIHLADYNELLLPRFQCLSDTRRATMGRRPLARA